MQASFSSLSGVGTHAWDEGQTTQKPDDYFCPAQH